MNKKYMQSFVMAVFLCMTTLEVSAEHPAHHADATEWLDHNKRLLTETAVGTGLAGSDDQRVIYLYKQATKLLVEAQANYDNGKYDDAMRFSKASIKIIYVADRIHYTQ